MTLCERQSALTTERNAKMDSLTLAFIGAPGPTEMIVIGIIAVLLFGSRLPSVARSLGRSFIEFKKGMSGVEDEVRDAIHSVPDASSLDDAAEPSAPRFEPPRPYES